MLIKFLAHSPIPPDRIAGESLSKRQPTYLPVGPASSEQLVCARRSSEIRKVSQVKGRNKARDVSHIQRLWHLINIQVAS